MEAELKTPPGGTRKALEKPTYYGSKNMHLLDDMQAMAGGLVPFAELLAFAVALLTRGVGL